MVITAYAEDAKGPGWYNMPVWYIWRDGNGKLTLECLQPKEQTPEILALYRISQAAHEAMTAAVRRRIKAKGRGKT